MKLIGLDGEAGLGGNAIVSERRVSLPLRSHFSDAWYLTIPKSGGPRVLSVLPDGCAELVWSNGKLHVLGPGRTAYDDEALPGQISVALRFKPGVAPVWFGIDASDLMGNRLMLDDCDRRSANELYEAIGDATAPKIIAARMEAALSASVPKRDFPAPCHTAIIALLRNGRFADGRLSHALQDLSNLSERTVRRETTRFFGYGPKTLERIVRLQRFLRLARRYANKGLAFLATTAGYADQSHLTREARDLTGLTPKMLLSYPVLGRPMPYQDGSGIATAPNVM